MIKFIIYFVLVNAGLIFRWLHWRVEEECHKFSDQCADAGFGWEALGSILFGFATPTEAAGCGAMGSITSLFSL